jgi:hypothetical protein
VPPPKRISPSDVLNDRYGTTDARFHCQHKTMDWKERIYSRCDVPQRPVSLLPEMRTDSAMFDSVAT